MKKLFMLFALLVIAIPPIASADHIGIYTDCTGSSCTVAPGFNQTTAVVHKFSVGATASRFKIVFPPGSNVFAFVPGGSISLPYVVNGDQENGITVGYGECLTGSWCVGTLVAILQPGPMCMRPATGFSSVMYTDCDLVELPATGSSAMVGSFCPGDYGGGGPCDPVAVESSTWGSVKSLYR